MMDQVTKVWLTLLKWFWRKNRRTQNVASSCLQRKAVHALNDRLVNSANFRVIKYV